jgi:hypothetical protein
MKQTKFKNAFQNVLLIMRIPVIVDQTKLLADVVFIA